MVVLVLGAVGGYYGVARQQQDASELAVALDGRGPAPAVLGAAVPADPERAAAEEAAQLRAAAAAALAAERAAKANALAERNRRASRTPARTSYPVPGSCQEYDGNRALGCALLLDAGFGLEQMPCLDRLWTRESGWNHRSVNQSSGAYGIPQALPGDKMASYGSDWRTNPVPQIRWGLAYIGNRYGNPCAAWSFFQTHNWY